MKMKRLKIVALVVGVIVFSGCKNSNIINVNNDFEENNYINESINESLEFRVISLY